MPLYGEMLIIKAISRVKFVVIRLFNYNCLFMI